MSLIIIGSVLFEGLVDTLSIQLGLRQVSLIIIGSVLFEGLVDTLNIQLGPW